MRGRATPTSAWSKADSMIMKLMPSIAAKARAAGRPGAAPAGAAALLSMLGPLVPWTGVTK